MSAAPIPKTAPFAEDEIAILTRVVGPASATQRAWLAGFLAGLDAGNANMPAPPPRAPEPLSVLFASESGNAERLAGDVAKAARKKGFKPTVIDLADLDLAALPRARRLVVIASTWGEGEPPARAALGYAALMGEAAPRVDCDLEYAEPAARWIDGALAELAPAEPAGSVIPVDFSARDLVPDLGPVETEIREHVNLN